MPQGCQRRGGGTEGAAWRRLAVERPALHGEQEEEEEHGDSSARDLRVEAEAPIEAEETRTASECSSSTWQCVSVELQIVVWLMFCEIAMQAHQVAWLISVFAVAALEERDGNRKTKTRTRALSFRGLREQLHTIMFQAQKARVIQTHHEVATLFDLGEHARRGPRPTATACAVLQELAREHLRERKQNHHSTNRKEGAEQGQNCPCRR